MKSKKIIAFISALACFVSVTACEKNVNKKEKPASSSISDSSSIAETTAAENEENKTDKADSKIDESSVNDIEEITTEAPTEAITEEPTEIPAEKIESKTLSEDEFFELLPMNFSFASGVGGWETNLRFDGSSGLFEGEYHDTEYDLENNETPDDANVIYYYCNFKGKLNLVKKINDYVYEVKFDNVEILNDTVFDEEFLEGISRVEYTDSYGVDANCTYHVYFNGIATKDVPEEMMSWIRMPLGWNDKTIPEILPYTCIYNVNDQQAFIGH